MTVLGQSADNLHLIWVLNVWVTRFLRSLICFVTLVLLFFFFFNAVGLLGQSPDGKLWSVHATLVKLRVQFAFICTSSLSALSGCLIWAFKNSSALFQSDQSKEAVLH